MKGEFVGTTGGEQQIGAERRLLPGERDRRVAQPFARGEMPPLVELAIIRQEHLRHDAEQPAAVDRDAAIVKPAAPAQWRTDDKDRRQLLAGRDEARDLSGDRLEHRVLKQ